MHRLSLGLAVCVFLVGCKQQPATTGATAQASAAAPAAQPKAVAHDPHRAAGTSTTAASCGDSSGIAVATNVRTSETSNAAATPAIAAKALVLSRGAVNDPSSSPRERFLAQRLRARPPTAAEQRAQKLAATAKP